MNILYIGPDAPETSSRHRADALSRLGHEVRIVNPRAVLPANRVLSHLNFRTGYRLFTGDALRLIQRAVGERRFDVAWVDGGYLISPQCVRWLKSRSRFVVNYCIDDPTGPREPSNWTTYCRAVPDYDLCVVVRDVNIGELRTLGAKDVLHVIRSYDETAHARLPYSAEEEKKWSSEVVFVGTWMPERGPFMAELIRNGVPLAIYGDRWNRAREWPAIQAHWRGAAAAGPNYVRAIQYAKVALGMLSKGNRDLHTQRSSEIPFIGTAFCAERTAEHRELFEEGFEALFWETPQECAANCSRLLRDDVFRQGMARAARERVIGAGRRNEEVCAAVISRLLRREEALVAAR